MSHTVSLQHLIHPVYTCIITVFGRSSYFLNVFDFTILSRPKAVSTWSWFRFWSESWTRSDIFYRKVFKKTNKYFFFYSVFLWRQAYQEVKLNITFDFDPRTLSSLVWGSELFPTLSSNTWQSPDLWAGVWSPPAVSSCADHPVQRNITNLS